MQTKVKVSDSFNQESLNPFILNFVEKFDEELYEDAIKASEMLAETYDPKTQTSNPSPYAGSQLTYDATVSGIVFISRDDNKQVDT